MGEFSMAQLYFGIFVSLAILVVPGLVIEPKRMRKIAATSIGAGPPNGWSHTAPALALVGRVC